MTATLFTRRRAGPPAAEQGQHLLTIGQDVRLRSTRGRQATKGDIYRITGVMPVEAGAPQYRIRSAEENHERVAMQDELEPLDASGSGAQATLMERTFGYGQRTKA
ncbi:hypothetical protein [Stappia indica]|jgi:hypothetical protein|uniref:Uncharacterized protein n=1 Tax=Stappia indica TaxID=538381 RepID=A0A857C5A5_9HYPH|nr:hypothetical protein [Stappia indica]QGZ34123.1 hypothetical protein GH266_06110 [Stappia indica]